jgi:hypothetical protein
VTTLVTLLLTDLLFDAVKIPAWCYIGIAIAWCIWYATTAVDTVTALLRMIQFYRMLQRMREDVRQERRSQNKARHTVRRIRRRIGNVLQRQER